MNFCFLDNFISEKGAWTAFIEKMKAVKDYRVESFDSKEPIDLWWMKYVHPEIIK